MRGSDPRGVRFRDAETADAAAILGVLALTRASLGLYAVMAFDVSHPRREIGVRRASRIAPLDALRSL